MRTGWLALFALAALTACVSSDPTPESKTKTARDGGGVRGPSGTGTLRLENKSDQVIFRVRLKLKQQPVWGFDRLSESDVIKAGEARSWKVPSGTYLIQVEFGDGTSLQSSETYTVVKDGSAVCTIHGSKPKVVEGTLTIHNGTPWAISRVRFSLNTAMSWGGERLNKKEILKPGARRSWSVPPGKYNLKITFQDGTSEETGAAHKVKPGDETVFNINPP